MIEDNIMSMAELAKANKIKVVLGSVPPSVKFGWRPDLQPADKIVALNEWIRNYAKANKVMYLDYYSSLVDDNKGMKAIYSEDGVHPNSAGYKVMEGIVKAVIKKLQHR
jgi:lysophospholipase L1-like esterase